MITVVLVYKIFSKYVACVNEHYIKTVMADHFMLIDGIP